MKLEVVTLDNKKSGDAELKPSIFKVEVKEHLIHQLVKWQLAKRRAGTQKVKSRSEVTGTTKKPFRQKGTGNARQGSLKGPHQRGGGVANAFSPRSYEFKINKKVRVGALKSALSAKAAEGKIKIIDSAVVDSPKTSDLKNKLEKAGINSALVVRGDSAKDNFYLASRSIEGVNQIPQYGLNVYDILSHDELVFTKHALDDLQKRLS